MTTQPAVEGHLRRYAPGEPIDVTTFTALGSAAGLGATILEGDPEVWVRFDFNAGGMSSGLFMSTRGKLRYPFPATEFATILEGRVSVQRDGGEVQVLGPGESYFVTRGEVVTMEALDDRAVKAFFNAGS
jgi:uncharacterized cupin superfamily protein